jgi:hypothetical protein
MAFNTPKACCMIVWELFTILYEQPLSVTRLQPTPAFTHCSNTSSQLSAPFRASTAVHISPARLQHTLVSLYRGTSNNGHCRGISVLSVIGVFVSWGFGKWLILRSCPSYYPIRFKGHPWLAFSNSLAFRAAIRAPVLVTIAVANWFV